MRWLPATPVKYSTAQLAEQIRHVVDDPQINPLLNAKSISQTLLRFYAGTLMQPMDASLFKGLSETELDHILSSFSAKQCIPNQGLLDVLSRCAAKPAWVLSTSWHSERNYRSGLASSSADVRKH